MGTLIEQINELISVLEIVNPEAAAKYRGGLPNQPGQPIQPINPRQPIQLTQPENISMPQPAAVPPEIPVISMGVAPTVTDISPTVTEIASTMVEIAPSVSNISSSIAVSPISGEQISDESVHEDKPVRPLTENLLHVNLKHDSLMQGILYSEILGRPVSLRQRRRRI